MLLLFCFHFHLFAYKKTVKFHHMLRLLVPLCTTWIATQSADNASSLSLLGLLLSWKLSWWHIASQSVQFFFSAQHSKLCVLLSIKLAEHFVSE